MAIRVVHYVVAGRRHWGVLRDQHISPCAGEFATTGSFLKAYSYAQLQAVDGSGPTLAEVQLLAPVTDQQQFLCQGANYRQHMLESGVDPDAKHFNMIFTKAAGCITAADSDVVKPREVRFLDYEIELGLVLKQDIHRRTEITEANLPDYVAGLVIVNDYSARDIQIPQGQFYKGKSYRGFGPVGPYLCLLAAEDFSYLQHLQLQLTVNGEVRQSDHSGNLVFGPAETLSELSAVHNLYAGDLLATGTPSGCALSVPSPARQRLAALLPERKKWQIFFKIQAGRRQYLQPGDRVEASIRSADGVIDLGVQHNRIVEDQQR